jgi:hypothetical protein
VNLSAWIPGTADGAMVMETSGGDFDGSNPMYAFSKLRLRRGFGLR